MVKASNLVRHWRRIPELARARRQSPAWKQVVVHYFQIGAPSYPFEIPLPGGGVVCTTSPKEVGVFWQIFIHHCYRIPPHCVSVVDAGANIGMFSLWFARQSPTARIISLEPFPKTFQLLQQNIRANALEGRVQVMQRALAAESGERQMIAFGESPTSRLLPRDLKSSGDPSFKVPCISLGDFLREQQIEMLDLLKMDVEGSEWEVLFSTPASVLRSIRHILLEYHEVHARFAYKPEQLFAYMANAGHTLTHHERGPGGTGLAFFRHTATTRLH